MSKPIGRTFYFEKQLWTKLDDDAKRCLRSSTKQLEAILKTYYAVEDVELGSESLEILGELMPKGKTKTAILEAGNRKKKRTA